MNKFIRKNCSRGLVGLLSFVILSMVGCDYFVDRVFYRKHVAMCFNANIGNIVMCSNKDNVVFVTFGSLFTSENKLYRQISEGADYDKFVEIAKKMGDTHFKEKAYHYWSNITGLIPGITSGRFLINPVDSITISSDISYSGGLSPGSSLNKVFWILCVDQDKYVANPIEQPKESAPIHYPTIAKDDIKRIYMDQNNNRDFNVILSHLSDVDLTKKTFVFDYFRLFSEDPMYQKPQTLTIKVKFRDGTKRTQTLEINKQ